MDVLSLCRVLQLASPSLPIGAFSYSTGLEAATEQLWVCDEKSLGQWLMGVSKNALARQDLPILLRLYRSWENQDITQVSKWNDLALAFRETAELRAEDEKTAVALARLARDMGIVSVHKLADWKELSALTVLSAFAYEWKITSRQLLALYLWSWVENQVAVAIKTIPLGQTAGQRLLATMHDPIQQCVTLAEALGDDRIGAFAPGQTFASMFHETQYSRMFQS